MNEAASTEAVTATNDNNGTASAPQAAPAQSQVFQQVALGIIAAVAAIWFLKFAANVFIPVLLGLILSYSLSPLVDWLKRKIYLPRPLGAASLLILILVGVSAGLWNLAANVAAISATLPQAARLVREYVSAPKAEPGSLMSDIRRATDELDKASAALNAIRPEPAVGPPAPPPTSSSDTNAIEIKKKANQAKSLQLLPQAAQPPPPANKPVSSVMEHIQTVLRDGASRLLSIGSTLGVAALLAFFLLCAGNDHRRNLLQLVGQSFTTKKITINILNEVIAQVQYFLATTAATSVALGLATWALFASFGVERAPMWAVVAALLHLIPYLGTALFAALCFVVGLASFNTLLPAAMLTTAWIVIQFLLGFGLMSYLQSRSSNINSVALFLGFLFFGWLWGGWGLVIAAPLLAAIKAVCDRVPSFKEMSVLLS